MLYEQGRVPGSRFSLNNVKEIITAYVKFASLRVNIDEMLENFSLIVFLHRASKCLFHCDVTAVHVLKIEQGNPDVQLLVFLSIQEMLCDARCADVTATHATLPNTLAVSPRHSAIGFSTI